jgi:Fe-S-cluster containining protein
MPKPFVCENCIECCANVFVTSKELTQIRRQIRLMPEEEVDRLRNQERGTGVCPLADIENKRCTVYDHRPWVCVKFGYVERMQCSYNKHIPLTSFSEAVGEHFMKHKDEIIDNGTDEMILGQSITWKSGLVKKR